MTEIILETKALTSFCKRVLKAKPSAVGVDTEFLREKTYWPQMCLIQIEAAGETVLIDPLAEGIDLKPLEKVFKHPDMIKIFHAAGQDLEGLHGLMGCIPAPIYDTQVGSMLTQGDYMPSYAALVGQITDDALEDALGRYDWAKRPLAPVAVSYAAGDVRYLKELYALQTEKLRELERHTWLEEEMQASLACVVPEEFPSEDCWRKVTGFGTVLPQMDPLQFAVLRVLAYWREREAQKRNVAKNRLLRSERLLNLALIAHDANFFSEVARVSRGDASLQKALKRLLAQDRETLEKVPHPKGLTTAQDVTFKKLKKLLKEVAEELGIPAPFIATQQSLGQLAKGRLSQKLAKGWRWDVFGKEAASVAGPRTPIKKSMVGL